MDIHECCRQTQIPPADPRLGRAAELHRYASRMVRWMKSKRSPYLVNQSRLADLIAAIQIMGTYPWASRTVESWLEKLGQPASADNWATVFGDHPEFFRLNGQWASLRWRHGYDRTYDPKRRTHLTDDEINSLEETSKESLSRAPLSPDQIDALVRTALDMHARAIAHAEERRWLVPLLVGLLGGILGALIGSLVPFLLK